MGKKVLAVLEQLDQVSTSTIKNVAKLLVKKVAACVTQANSRKLPSARSSMLWYNFHQLRNCQEIKEAWKAFVELNIPTCSSASRDAHSTLQILLDHLLKKMIHNQAEAVSKKTTIEPLEKIPPRESNAVRHMSGFVAVKLLKKFKRPSKNPRVQQKRELFVRVLTSMRAVNQPGEPDTVEDYTTLWGELIDRGGLYQINDQVIILLKTD